jgi:hypothetical protein
LQADLRDYSTAASAADIDADTDADADADADAADTDAADVLSGGNSVSDRAAVEWFCM